MSTPTPATFADGFLVPTEAKEDKKRNPPKPLNGTPPKADPFPIQQLPVIIRDAVDEVQQATQAPEALVVSCALSAVSAAAPPATIYRDEGLDGPTSLFIMTVAKSGERKTACDKLFTSAIREWEAEQAVAAKPRQAEYRALMTTWAAKEAGLKEAIKKAARDVNPNFDAGAGAQLIELEKQRPQEPRIPSLLRQDDTPEALAAVLQSYPVAAVLSSEAGVIFGAHGMNPDSVMRNLAQLNVCWDGGPLKRGRTTTQSVDIQCIRVTVGLQVQPDVLMNFMGKSGTLARGIGWLARFLFCNPESTQGGRFYKAPVPGRPALRAFNDRVKGLLGIPACFDAEGRLLPTALQLSAEAKEAWVTFYDSVEEELGDGREYFDVQDVASKTAEQAVRIAAAFHIFELRGGLVSVDHMRSACHVARWYLDEALRFFKLAELAEDVKNALKLEEWLISYMREKGVRVVSTRTLQQFGPVRDKLKLGEAIDCLGAHDRLFKKSDGQKREVFFHIDVLKEWGMPPLRKMEW